jgi:L-arabinose isomerase
MAAGLPGGTSFMEDYTYHLGPGEPKILGAHMLEVCPSIAAGHPALEIHPLGIGGREDPGADGVHRDPPGPAVVAGCATWATGSGWCQRGRRRRARRAAAPEPCRSRCAVWEPRPDLGTSAEAWIMAGAPAPHGAVHRRRVEELHDLAELARTELLVIDADTTPRASPRSCGGTPSRCPGGETPGAGRPVRAAREAPGAGRYCRR